jgi:hypothetical protein
MTTIEELSYAVNQLQSQLATAQSEHTTRENALLQQIEALRANVASSSSMRTASATPKPPKPEKYGGRAEDVLAWTMSMQLYLDACGIDPVSTASSQLAAAFLKDRAMLWYLALPAPPSSWNELKEQLIAAFTILPRAETARKRVTSLKQRTSVVQYAEQFKTALLDLKHWHEDEKIFFFLQGLKDDVRLQVELKQPATLAEAIRLASLVDHINFQRRSSTSRGSSTPLSSGRPYSSYSSRSAIGAGSDTATPMELGSAHARSSPPGSSSVSGSGRSRRLNLSPEELALRKEKGLCFLCGKYGHIAKQCRTQQQQQQQRPTRPPPF